MSNKRGKRPIAREGATLRDTHRKRAALCAETRASCLRGKGNTECQRVLEIPRDSVTFSSFLFFYDNKATEGAVPLVRL